METGTCCCLASSLARRISPAITPPGFHNRPLGDGSLWRTNLKRCFARRVQKYKRAVGWIWMCGMERRWGGKGGGEGGGSGGTEGSAGGGLSHCFDRVSLVLSLAGCQNEMKAELMRSRQTAETLCHREHGQCPHAKVKIIRDWPVLNCIWEKFVNVQCPVRTSSRGLLVAYWLYFRFSHV